MPNLKKVSKNLTNSNIYVLILRRLVTFVPL